MQKKGDTKIIIGIIVGLLVIGGIFYFVFSGEETSEGKSSEGDNTEEIRIALAPILSDFDETMVLMTPDFESEIDSVEKVGEEWKVSVTVSGDSGNLEDTLYFFYDGTNFVRVDSKNSEIINKEVTLAEFDEFIASMEMMAAAFG